VDDGRLREMVAAQLDRPVDAVEVLTSGADPVTYDLDSITTVGRFWVHGQALVEGALVGYRFFVKVVQSFARSPLFARVPSELRATAEASVPWRTEAMVYRSDLRDRLPAGLGMPRAFGVYDLEDGSVSMWLEALATSSEPAPWELDRFRRAAALLGRLAASPTVAVRRDVGGHDWHVRRYYDGRLSHQVLPMLRDDQVWRHPLVAGAFDAELRDRLRDAGERAEAYLDELASLPVLTGHGDPCPNNLLAPADEPGSFILIDFGFWGPLPVGFDLGQLLVGDIQLGRLDADQLPVIEEAIAPAYVAGLRAEGCPITPDVVRRAHALQLVVFTGLSTIPFEHFDRQPTAALHSLAVDRAALSRFSLDLVGA
jgi:hypothetical protein